MKQSEKETSRKKATKQNKHKQNGDSLLGQAPNRLQSREFPIKKSVLCSEGTEWKKKEKKERNYL